MLVLDIGNTNLRWALVEDGRIGEVHIVRHAGAMPLDLLADWESLDAPVRVVVSNVAGEGMAAALTRVTRACWGLMPEFVATRADCAGVRIAYADPARFGVDRWLALLAAHAEQPHATLILDAGSAATFDLLLADGRHLGGLILPGVEMMRASLLAGTQIPRIESEPGDQLWAMDTGTAVAAGSLQAITALAARVRERLAEDSTTAPRLLLTGGDAERLHPLLGADWEHQPDLVLRGLLRVATL